MVPVASAFALRYGVTSAPPANFHRASGTTPPDYDIAERNIVAKL
jgi:hypothetical protein